MPSAVPRSTGSVAACAVFWRSVARCKGRLTVEVARNHGRVDLGALADIAHRGPVVTPLGEQLSRRLGKALAAVGGAAPLTDEPRFA